MEAEKWSERSDVKVGKARPKNSCCRSVVMHSGRGGPLYPVRVLDIQSSGTAPEQAYWAPEASRATAGSWTGLLHHSGEDDAKDLLLAEVGAIGLLHGLCEDKGFG